MSERDRLLTSTMILKQPRPRVFAFFAEAANLETITPPELRFRILTPPPIVMGQGTLIEYAMSLHCVPLRWQALISAWEPPSHFVDEQVRGPYALWVHTHRFADTAAGGTRIDDEVRYRLPWAPASNLIAPIVRRQLGRIFRYREQRVRQILQD
jgi:ligand-binding SRPBCC domain-containing protein